MQVQSLSKMIVSLLKQPDFDSKNYKNLSEVSIFQELTTQNLKKKLQKRKYFLFFSKENLSQVKVIHCMKSVCIRSFTSPYSVRMRENTDQKNS